MSAHDLDESIPTIAGMAWLAATAFGRPEAETGALSREALTLLIAAKDRGMFEIRAAGAEFDSSDRLLAVCVEASAHQRLTFRRHGDPRRTLRFLDAFRELCAAGLVIHQLQKEFSLTSKGFELATHLAAEDYETELAFAQSVEI